ncbi:hypothetical protein L0P73_22900, partial [[Clostridium] innocuum]|uniref:hypothetical protein n=1 Tax=Clostridium innocuum TaxID=1522 RepID=UPI001EE06037
MQKDTIPAPNAPEGTTESAMTAAGWTKVPSTNFQLIQDYEKAYFEANRVYTLYIVKQETADTQVSNVRSKSVELGPVTQSGTIAFTGNEVVGKTVSATLKDANNNKGTWKWYMSTTDCGTTGTDAAPSINDTAKWKQLASGYSPTIDSDTSTLTISEDMWKHYIKAEFVPNSDIGYGGESIKKMAATYVKKIYDEKISIKSDTKDGEGNDAAYSGTKVTATVENWIGNGDDLKGRFKMYINESSPTLHTNSTYNGNTMTTTEENWSQHNGKHIYAELTVPSNIALYVDVNLNAISSGKKYTSDQILYKYGTSIKNETDLKNFILGTDNYTNRGGTYVITNNISFTSSTKFTVPTTSFSGTLDGDGHVINYLPVYLFDNVKGTSSNYAVIKNLILKNANLTYSDKTKENVGVIARRLENYVKVNRVFAVDSNLASYGNVGFIAGSTGPDNGVDVNTVEISECGTVGGSVSYSGVGSLGGFVGFASSNKFYDNYSIGTIVYGHSAQSAGGYIGYGTRVGKDYVQRNYTASKVQQEAETSNAYSASGGIFGSVNTTNTTNIKNNFFDSNIMGQFIVNQSNAKATRGTAKTTQEMVGNGLKTSFSGTSAWVYKDGYYPLLSWLQDNKIANLYGATRMAFVSIDNATSSSNLAVGNLYGPVKIPNELQTKGFTYSTSSASVLKITAGGTILPVGAVGTTAKITIRYDDTENGGYATNTYDFTVKKKVNALNVNDVTVNGTTNPGKVLTANASGATTFQWYRRKAGTVSREAISGAT